MASQGNVSRLAQMQMRYQQKQKQELQQKRNEMTGGRTLAALDSNDNSKIQIGNGKVRQMFDERRQRVVGIDKSYPLQPISAKETPNNTVRQVKTTVSSVRRSVNPNQNGISNHSLKLSAGSTMGNMYPSTQYNDTESITSRSNKSGISNKLFDNDYIENEQIPDIFSQIEDEDTLDSGRMSVGKQMANLNLLNNNTSSGSIKLRPVITKKSMNVGTTNQLNSHKKLPTQPSRARSNPITPEKVIFTEKSYSAVSPVKKPLSGGSTKSISQSSSTRSSASSTKPSRPMVSTPPENSVACRICSRYFNNDRIEKHETICQKNSSKKRKIFDATKHRVQGTEAEIYVKKATRTVNKKQPETTKKSDWRRKHEEFIQAIRSAKQVQQHLAKGGKLSDLPPPPPSENPDYVQCPHCQRRFNESAAQRHIPKCVNFQFNKPKSNAVSKANLGKKRF